MRQDIDCASVGTRGWRAIYQSAGLNSFSVSQYVYLFRQLSILLDKWYGESQKLTSAIFSLAEKMQPCIIFIDEIDVLLRSRNSSDHEATAMIKSQFMSLWDGFISSARTRVIIMGATNRPQDIDAAILRRMPARFHVPMPDSHQRAAILRAILVDELYDAPALDAIAADTCAGMSGSDLREVCRMAALAAHRRENDDDTTITPTISDDDLRAGVRKVIGARVQPSYTRMKMIGEALD
jgi:SpoVK/Ycf46/Vps4 family AAA+-type ATPase